MLNSFPDNIIPPDRHWSQEVLKRQLKKLVKMKPPTVDPVMPPNVESELLINNLIVQKVQLSNMQGVMAVRSGSTTLDPLHLKLQSLQSTK